MGEVLRAGRADGLAACSIVDFVQAPASGARAQLRRDRSSGNPAPRCLAPCIAFCITFRPHLYCKCIAWPLRKEVAAGRIRATATQARAVAAAVRRPACASCQGPFSPGRIFWRGGASMCVTSGRADVSHRAKPPPRRPGATRRQRGKAAQNTRIERVFLRRQDKARRRAQLHIPGKAR